MRWSQKEDELLRLRLSQGRFYREIGEELDRPWFSVRQRVKRLGLKRRKEWTQSEEYRVFTLLEKGFMTAEIAKKLDRSVYSVRGRLQRLGVSVAQGRRTVNEAARELGVSAQTLRAAARRLELKFTEKCRTQITDDMMHKLAKELVRSKPGPSLPMKDLRPWL